jgi:DNA-binding beta-propeller fold protein YncE
MQNDMKNPRVRFRLFFVIFAAISSFVISGCDPFANDGITNSAEVASKGYFYVTESESNLLLMLNYNNAELKRWSLNSLASDKSVQGVTFDGQYLWLSFSGNEDKIVRVNAESDTLVALKSIDAPSAKKGTIRGIAYDGTFLWFHHV